VPASVIDSAVTGRTITSLELTEFSNASTTLLQRKPQHPQQLVVGLSAGTSFRRSATAIGIIANAGLSNSWNTRDISQQQGDVTGRNRVRFSDGDHRQTVVANACSASAWTSASTASA
jgi:hypothetical protein